MWEIRSSDTVERAAIYHRIPKNAPMDVAKTWLRARMERSDLVNEFIVAA